MENNNISLKPYLELQRGELSVIIQGVAEEEEKRVVLDLIKEFTNAINKLAPTKEQLEDRAILKQDKLLEVDASILLLDSGLMVENQLNHPNNKAFIRKCNDYLVAKGVQEFKELLSRCKKAKPKSIQAYIYASIKNALEKS